MLNIATVKKNLFPETFLWAARVLAAGGGFEPNSVAIANNLVRQIKNANFGSKVIYLLPMLGRGIGAARTPLIDILNVGSATNTAFVDGDFNQSTGLQGNGSTKYLDANIKASQLGMSNNGGLGWWENNITIGANSEPIGAYGNAGNSRFVLDLRSTRRFFCWGAPANVADDSIGAINGHYYGNRSSSTSRIIYLNGSSIATNTTNDSSIGSADTSLLICGSNDAPSPITPYPGRGAVAYMTDGTLTDIDVAQFDTMLRQYLLGPTGKPQS